jgi:hypothetical protein
VRAYRCCYASDPFSEILQGPADTGLRVAEPRKLLVLRLDSSFEIREHLLHHLERLTGPLRLLLQRLSYVFIVFVEHSNYISLVLVHGVHPVDVVLPCLRNSVEPFLQVNTSLVLEVDEVARQSVNVVL